MTFYENFLKLCNDVGKSPSRVADEIGISKSIISRWKNGGGISDITAVKIAEYFGVSTGVLKDNLSIEGLQYMIAKDNGLKKACAFLEAKEKENDQQKKTADQVASRLEEQIKVHGETGMRYDEYRNRNEVTKDDLVAAFFGDVSQLSKEDVDQMWDDVKDYAEYKLAQKQGETSRKETQKKD